MNKKCSDCPFMINIKEEAYALFSNRCPKCGADLVPSKLSTMNDLGLVDRVKHSINKWFGELGIEGTLEMLETGDNFPHSELFYAELFSRGLKIRVKKAGG